MFVSVLTTETSALGVAVPPLPVLSVLFGGFGSGSAAVAVALLSNAPAAVIVAVTLMVVFAPEASEAIVHGSAAQPLPLTPAIERFVGVSVTWIDVAVAGPAFATTSVYEIDCPGAYGPAVTSVFTIDTSADVESGTLLLDWFELTPSALAVAMFVTCTLLTSAGVTLYVAVQVTDSP